jgi:hypothetical protein
MILEESISKYRKPSNDASQSFNISETHRYKGSHCFNDIKIETSKSIINFDLCLPGQVSKRSLKIKNISKQSIELEIKFNQGKDLNEVFKSIINENINDVFGNLTNSQNIYSCFSIDVETIKLDQDEIVSINITLTAPFIKSKLNLFTTLEIKHNDTVIQNIPIQAYIETPKLLCLKSTAIEGELPIILLELEPGIKYKIPFKNQSLIDLELDFILEKKFTDNLIKHKDLVYECQLICYPNNIIIPAQGSSTIDLIAKVTKTQFEGVRPQDRIRKVLIGKVKDASVYYTFFIEAFFK